MAPRKTSRPYKDPRQTEFVFSVYSTKPLKLVTADEIYVNASQPLLARFNEDRRYERKPARINPLALQDWFSMFANTAPDGGLISVGVRDDGSIEGCSCLSDNQLNELEKIRRLIPDARYQSKRIPVTTSHGEDSSFSFESDTTKASWWRLQTHKHLHDLAMRSTC